MPHIWDIRCQSHFPTMLLTFFCLLIGILMAGCPPKQPPSTTTPITFVPMQEFASLPPRQLVAVHVKFTYLSEQTKPVPTVVFGSFRRLVNINSFAPLRKPGVSYVNDELSNVENFSVTTDELQKMLQAANGIPAVQQGQRDGQYLSFMVIDDRTGGQMGSEVILNKQEAQTLVQSLRDQISVRNGIAIDILDSFLKRAF